MNLFDNMIFVIPALNPDSQLLRLLQMLRLNASNQMKVVIVDDGSLPESESFFEIAESKYNAHILRHKENKGRGSALKTAFHYILKNFEHYDGVTTIQSDKEHPIDSITACLKAFYAEKEAVIFGSRFYKKPGSEKNQINWRDHSSEEVLKLITGLDFKDTKTGLMIIPMEHLEEFTQIEGEGSDYEINLALFARDNQIRRIQVPIEAVTDENQKPVYAEAETGRPMGRFLNYHSVFLRYLFSSGVTFITDNLLFTVVLALFAVDNFQTIVIATAIGRIISSTINYLLNRYMVFKGTSSKSAYKYFLLTAVKLVISSILVSFVNSIFTFVHTTLLKIIIDGFLFIASYYIQKKYVFGKGNTGNPQ